MFKPANHHPVACRICTELTPPQTASNLFVCRAVDGYSMAELVALIGDIPVRQEEVELPAWCCFQCQLDVEMAYRVRVLCRESDQKLREMLGKTVKPEPVGLFEEMEIEDSTIGSAEPIPENQEVADNNGEKEDDLVEELMLSGAEQRDEEALVEQQDFDVFEEVACDKKRWNMDVEGSTIGSAEPIPENQEVADNNGEKEDDLVEELMLSGAEQRDEEALVEQQDFDVFEEVACDKKRWNMDVEGSTIGSAEPIPENQEVADKNGEQEDDLIEELMLAEAAQRDEDDQVKQQDFDVFEEVACDKKRWNMDVEAAMIGSSEPIAENQEADKNGEKEDDLIEELKPSGARQEDGEGQVKRRDSDVYEEIACDKKRCCGCHQLFENEEKLLEHAKLIHALANPPEGNKIMKLCEVCFHLVKKKCFKSHQSTPSTMFRCKDCSELFTTAKKVRSHHLMRHYSYRTCCSCNIKFETVEALREHSDLVHLPKKPPADNDRPFVCNVCYLAYKSYGHLYEHRTSKGCKLYQCSQCELFFRGPTSLKRHEDRHRNPQVLQCHICSKISASYEALRLHIVTHTTTEFRYKCDECKKGYRSRIGLIHHKVRNHGAQGSFQCQFCPNSFTKEAALKRHCKRFHTAKLQETKTCRTRQDMDQQKSAGEVSHPKEENDVQNSE